MIRVVAVVMIFAFVACSSGPEPALEPEPLPPGATEPAPPPPRRVYIGDTATKRFHREGCPEIESLDLSHQRLFEDPGEALDRGYSPCKVCDPFRGW
jgi:hypothetical protein